MNHREAVKMLDMAREGQPIPNEVLSAALFKIGEWDDSDNNAKPYEPSVDVREYVECMRQAGFL
jgi:hypothetical protein